VFCTCIATLVSYSTSEVRTAVNIDYELLDMTPYSLVGMLYLLCRSSYTGLDMYTSPRVTRGVYRSPLGVRVLHHK